MSAFVRFSLARVLQIALSPGDNKKEFAAMVGSTGRSNHRQQWLGLQAIFLVILLCAGCKAKTPDNKTFPFLQRYSTNPSEKTDLVKLEGEDGQWIMPAKNYASTRFSGLNQINAGNVKDLKVAWTFSTGSDRGEEAAPIVVNNTMYIVTPFPNTLYALDLTQPGAPAKWSYKPKDLNNSAKGVACCDWVNRGCTYANGKIYFNTLDGKTAAVNAATGDEVWVAQVADINRGESITMAPLVVKNKVLVGDSGGEFGVRGSLTALDTETGKQVWKAYSTGPDKDCLIGANFHPFYDSDKGQDLGVKTWPPDLWKIGGGTTWGWISYDPALDLVYYGTGNPGPWNPEQRPGDNKWTCGMFARRPDTGEAVWAYQWSPHDVYDHDGINELLLLDLPINGQVRKVLVRPERNGYVYVLDRVTGQVLSANPFAFITDSTGVDLKTGRLKPVQEKAPGFGRVTRMICP
jgi:PQQ-dependent dehydrogenase (methanol/ethanol family)